jgi:hypothetical protein
MKLNSLIIFITAAFFLAGCSDNKSTTNEKQEANTSSAEKKEEPTSKQAAQGDDIVGEWELLGFIGDTNDNLQIDEEERKNLKTPSYKDYMKLNSDGTGLFTIGKMEGRYEIKNEESSGRKVMTWYDKGNGRHRVGSIMKVTKDELTIKEPGGNGLFLWKKI